MKALLTIIFLHLAIVGYGHDIRLAIFELSQEKKSGSLILNISFDKEDLEKSVNNKYGDYSTENRSNLIIKYLNDNFQLTINEECLSLNVKSIKTEGDFIRLKAYFSEAVTKVSKIRVFNTCLIDFTEGHSNIFKSKLNGKIRSFRLTEKRISTEFEY